MQTLGGGFWLGASGSTPTASAPAPAPPPCHGKPQICPLKAASRLSSLLPGLKDLADDTTIEHMASTPASLGGALMLMVAENADEAATMQKKICNTLLYPKYECKWRSGDPMGPLYYHLEGNKVNVSAWLSTKVAPIALAPLRATLSALPDVLCQMPTDNLLNMPIQVKAQLVRWVALCLTE